MVCATNKGSESGNIVLRLKYECTSKTKCMPRICNCKSSTLFCIEVCGCAAGDESWDNVMEDENDAEDSVPKGIVFKDIIVVRFL